MFSKIKVMSDSKMLNSIAVPKPLILKSSIKSEAIKMMNAFMNKRKKPSVNRVRGMVSSMSKGLRKVFNIESVTATNTAVLKWAISTPGNR